MYKKVQFVISILVVVSIFSISCNSSHKLMKEADETSNYGSLKDIALERITKNSNDSYALAMLGKVYLLEGKPDSAAYYYEKAVQNDPQKPEYQTGLIDSKIVFGDTLLKNGFTIKARDSYLSAMKLDTTHFLALCRNGLVNRHLGKFDLAQDYYRKAFRLNTYADSLQKVLDYFDAAHVQSNLLMRKGIESLTSKQYQVAMESLEQAVAAKPDNKEAKYYSYLANGLFYYKRGSVGKLWNAIENFGLASSLKPEEVEPHFYMADAYIKKDDKDFENAIREYEEVLKLAPDSELAKEAQKNIDKLKARDKLLKEFWNKK
jgi:tetratricopeptide (TPR) repeat protein